MNHAERSSTALHHHFQTKTRPADGSSASIHNDTESLSPQAKRGNATGFVHVVATVNKFAQLGSTARGLSHLSQNISREVTRFWPSQILLLRLFQISPTCGWVENPGH